MRTTAPIEMAAGRGERITFLEINPDKNPEQRTQTSVRYSAPALESSKNPAATEHINEAIRKTRSDEAIDMTKERAGPISSNLFLFIKKSPDNLDFY